MTQCIYNTLRVLIIGDIHCRLDNFTDIDVLTDKILKIINQEHPDWIVLLGDLLHTHEQVNTLCLNKLLDLFDKLRKYAKLYIIVGNHDMINSAQFLSTHHWMNMLKEWSNVTIVDKPLIETHCSKTYTFLPYVPKGRFMEALYTLDENAWNKSSAIFCHQEFRGSQYVGKTSDDGDYWAEEYPQIISGHIHKHQILKNVYYVGSAIQVTFGETDKNIVSVFTSENGSDVKIEEILLDVPKKLTINTDLINIENLN